MYIGINNYELYTPEICDGHYCCRDCDSCHPWADEIMEKMEEAEIECQTMAEQSKET